MGPWYTLHAAVCSCGSTCMVPRGEQHQPEPVPRVVTPMQDDSVHGLSRVHSTPAAKYDVPEDVSMKTLQPIHSFNFILHKGEAFSVDAVKRQIDAMVAECAINAVTFVVGASQDHCQSTEIHWRDNSAMPTDAELTELLAYARSLGLRNILKPMLNPADGYWRAYIRFFDEDVPCEPKWSEWFSSYTEYMVHYARLAERTGTEMLLVGCELVGTDHREAEWRALIAQVRQVYGGLVSYNCDKYQEHNVAWWDACDAISSSGYYPVEDWPAQIERIRRVVMRYDLPFFFAEAGCPSTAGSGGIPNDWTRIGKHPLDLAEQVRFYEAMFTHSEPLDWHFGYCLWDWPGIVHPSYDPLSDAGYRVMGKPVATVIRRVFAGAGA